MVNKKEEKAKVTEDILETEPDEEGAITIISHLLIIDKETDEILVNKRA